MDLGTTKFGAETVAHTDTGRFCCDRALRLVGSCDYVYCAGRDADSVARADEDASNDACASYHQLHKSRSPLMYTQPHRVQIKLEENSRSTRPMAEYASVVRDAVLVRVKWGGARGDVGCWYYVQEVLVCYEWILGDFVGVVKGLSDIREVRAERKLVYDVREVHH